MKNASHIRRSHRPAPTPRAASYAGRLAKVHADALGTAAGLARGRRVLVFRGGLSTPGGVVDATFFPADYSGVTHIGRRAVKL